MCLPFQLNTRVHSRHWFLAVSVPEWTTAYPRCYLQEEGPTPAYFPELLPLNMISLSLKAFKK